MVLQANIPVPANPCYDPGCFPVSAGLNLSSLLEPSSLAWIQFEERRGEGQTYSYRNAVVSSSDISLGFVTSEDTFFAWATSNIDGQPVSGVEITVYGYSYQVGFRF